MSNAKTPSLVDALIPLLLLISLLFLSVQLFGADSSYGANQIALLICACVVGLIGLKNGLSWQDVEGGMLHGIGLAFKAILILLAVGSLIGSWILAGTVPTMIYYGVKLLSPEWFYAASCALCAIVAISIGSSWTVAGTLGIGLMGVAQAMGLSPAITAGAIISGAYFGDKLSPLSDTTNLAAAVTGNDLFEHIRHMLWTTLPAITLALIFFALLGSTPEASHPADIETLLHDLQNQFAVGWYLLLPLVALLAMAWRQFPAFPTLIIGTLLGAAFALIFQPQVVAQLAGSDTVTIGSLIKGVWISFFNGYSADSGNAMLDKLLSKGGMASMLNTVWLIISAMAFGGAMERVGLLQRLVEWALARVQSIGSLIATTVATCIGANIFAGDQFMAIILPGRMYREAYEKFGLKTINLSRTLEDSGTLTSALIPWNTCGAYMAGTLGVATWSYAPYAFFNLLCPVIAIIYGSFHIKLAMLNDDVE
jgi:NhaC family Na+:H+ antiporter